MFYGVINKTGAYKELVENVVTSFKKKKEVLMDEESKFINRSIENGYSEDLAKEIYNFYKYSVNV